MALINKVMPGYSATLWMQALLLAALALLPRACKSLSRQSLPLVLMTHSLPMQWLVLALVQKSPLRTKSPP